MPKITQSAENGLTITSVQCTRAQVQMFGLERKESKVMGEIFLSYWPQIYDKYY